MAVSGRYKGRCSTEKTGYGTEVIKCPFFKSHAKTVISCEGLTDDSVIRMVYRSSRGRELQENAFCAGRYEACEIYRAIVCAKYMEDV